MGRITAIIPDDIEIKFRHKIVEKFGGKKGDMSIAVTEAISEWVGEDQ